MPQWSFSSVDPKSVRIEVTQRDQFNNDDVGMAEALVREVIQNSSDAGNGVGTVKVRFSFRTVIGPEARELAAELAPLKEHYDACGLDFSPAASESIRVLVIEDFNTKGLTGKFDDIDKDNFDCFWRAVGKSEKSGQSGGRWGLGKLVYSSSSLLNLFYGLTLRAGDVLPALMGQAVLSNHRIGKTLYPAHAFWYDRDAEDELGLQLPVQNPVIVGRFRDVMGISRTTETGFSIAIPFLKTAIDEANIIAGVVNNYYFPILAGQLVVEVGDIVVNKDTFLKIADEIGRAMNLDTPFFFVQEISRRAASPASFKANKPIGIAELDETFFSEEDLKAMKQTYTSRELVHVRVPVRLRKKAGTDIESSLDLFLKAMPDGDRPFALIARGPITLVGERRYMNGIMARCALIAMQGGIAEFLGDAENPAHTAWNVNAEKLTQKWQAPQTALSTIRHALRNLYSLIAEHSETEDNDALLDFFSLMEKAQANSNRKKKIVKPEINVPPREKAISIHGREGGFDIVAGPGAATWKFPRVVRVRIAYDMVGANPFNRHSRYDFDLGTGDIEVKAANADVEVLKPNILRVTAHSPEFNLSARGFDVRRDVVVDARAI